MTLLFMSQALAGERIFAFSYGYGTVPQGGVEVEHYVTVEAPEAGPSWKHQVEVEYGITDCLESGLYVVAEQAGAGPLAFSEYKGRLRYRLGAEGVAPVDTALYLEYAGVPTFEEHEVEAKIIFAKHVKRFHGALNLEYVAKFAGDELAHKVEPTLGAAVRVRKGVHIGVEALSEIEFEHGEMEGPFALAGPSLHLAGEGGKFWWTIAVLAPLTGETNEHMGVVGRSLLAVNL